jgi:hypothetical protein
MGWRPGLGATPSQVLLNDPLPIPPCDRLPNHEENDGADDRDDPQWFLTILWLASQGVLD